MVAWGKFAYGGCHHLSPPPGVNETSGQGLGFSPRATEDLSPQMLPLGQQLRPRQLGQLYPLHKGGSLPQASMEPQRSTSNLQTQPQCHQEMR